jgi:hypothetical protein
VNVQARVGSASSFLISNRGLIAHPRESFFIFPSQTARHLADSPATLRNFCASCPLMRHCLLLPECRGPQWPPAQLSRVPLTFVLLAFGVGLGLSVVSPWAGRCISNDVQDRHRPLPHRHRHAVVLDRRLSCPAVCARDGLAASTATKCTSAIRRMDLSPGPLRQYWERRYWLRQPAPCSAGARPPSRTELPQPSVSRAVRWTAISIRCCDPTSRPRRGRLLCPVHVHGQARLSF